MRNTNYSNDLCQFFCSDYPADMRKLNAYNALRREPIFVAELIGVRASLLRRPAFISLLGIEFRCPRYASPLPPLHKGGKEVCEPGDKGN